MDHYDAVSVRLEGTGVLQSDLENAIKQAQNTDTSNQKGLVQATGWNRGPRIIIKNQNLNTTSQTRIIQVYGSMAEVCPMEILYGNFCYQEDTKGCVIDEKTAYDLFRDKKVVGNTITYNSKQYIIRGVVKSKEQVVMISDYGKKTTYSNLELVFSDMEKGEQLAKNFIESYQLSSDYMTIVEGNFYTRLLHNIILLPAVVIWLYFLFLSGKQVWKRRTIPLQCGLFIGLFILIGIVFLNNKTIQFYIPDRLIPTKWSDFDFWSNLFLEWKNRFIDFSYLIPLPKDQILRKVLILCNLVSLLTIAELIVLIRYLRAKKNKADKSKGAL